MIRYVSQHNNKNQTIIVFNTNRLTEEKLEYTLKNSSISKLQIYVYKFSNNGSIIWSQFKAITDSIQTAINIFSYSFSKIIKDDTTTRTFTLANNIH